MDKWNDTICPKIREKVDENIVLSRDSIAKPAVGKKFQVSKGENAFVVDLNKRTCSCREWDITGIPCIHAMSSTRKVIQNHLLMMVMEKGCI